MALLRAISSNSLAASRRLRHTPVIPARPIPTRFSSPLRIFVRFEHTYEEEIARTAHVRRYKLGDLSTRGASFLPNQTARPWERKAGPQARWIRMLGFWEMTMFGSVIICLFFFAYWVLPFERIFEHTREQTAFARRQFSHLFSGPGFRIRVREVSDRFRNNLREFADTMGPVQRRTLATHGVGLPVQVPASEGSTPVAKKPSRSSTLSNSAREAHPPTPALSKSDEPSHRQAPHLATKTPAEEQTSSHAKTEANTVFGQNAFSERLSTHHGESTVTIHPRVFEAAQNGPSRARAHVVPPVELQTSTASGIKSHDIAEVTPEGAASESKLTTKTRDTWSSNEPPEKSKKMLEVEELDELRRKWDEEKRAYDIQITEAIHQLEMEDYDTK